MKKFVPFLAHQWVELIDFCSRSSSHLEVIAAISWCQSCHSYRWTASTVAGRNSKTPIYILAEDPLLVCGCFVLYVDIYNF